MFTTTEESGIALGNSEIKDIIKLINLSKIKNILLKETIVFPLIKIVLPLMKNVPMSLSKNVLVPLGLPVAVSARDADIQKKFTVQKPQHWRFQMRKSKIARL